MRDTSPIPLYYRIYKDLRDKIVGGYFENGKLPTEKELCEKYNVSRMTVRKAMERLSMEGLIERKKGKGTFVKRIESEEQLSRLTGFTEEVGKGRVRSEVLVNRLVRIPVEAKKAFGLPENTLVILLKRIRYIDDVPVAIEESFLNPDVDVRILNILELDMSRRSLYEFLRDELKLSLDHAEEVIEVITLSAAQAKLLNQPAGSCALLRKRYTYTSDGRCVEYVLSVYRGDQFKFKVLRR
jgi:GntR family transcriptional regulator